MTREQVQSILNEELDYGASGNRVIIALCHEVLALTDHINIHNGDTSWLESLLDEED
jgi:hypothetical protein